MRILLTGGGTAGHVNPAVAIANYISSQEKTEIAFVGTKEGIESELIPKLGFKLYHIEIHGFERKLNFQNIKNVFEILKSVSDSKKIIKDFKPDIVIGTGGYVSGPVLYAAAKLNIPTIVHESNAYPGITTKILSKYVDTVAIGAEDAKKHLDEKCNTVYTGSPVRPDILSMKPFEARRILGLDEKPFIVSFGGSMGARDFNNAMVDFIISEAPKNKYKILMGTGKFNQYESVMNRFKDKGFDLLKYPDVTVSEYIYDMNVVLAAADIVVSRAGASTLCELTALGKPSILVPSPYVTENHQEHNARAVERQGGARVILEKDFCAESLIDTINELTKDKQTLIDMSKCAYKAGCRNSTEILYNEVKKLLNK